jgi:hypothetical protein
MVDTHANPSLVTAHVKHPVWDNFPEVWIREVMHVYSLWLALTLPPSPVVLIGTHEFHLLCVDRNHRLAKLLESIDFGVDVLELRVAVGVCGAFQGLAVALQAVASHIQ